MVGDLERKDEAEKAAWEEGEVKGDCSSPRSRFSQLDPLFTSCLCFVS